MSVTPKPVVHDSGVAYTGDVVIKNWIRAKIVMEQARRTYNERCSEAHRASAELATWLLPEDAKAGESFSIWYFDALFVVTKTDCGATVTIREAGKHFRENAGGLPDLPALLRGGGA